MERVRELRAMLKGWETEFERENGRRPGKADVAAASEDLKRLYREYRQLKEQKERAEQNPIEEQVSCWGSHLNRRPKAPNVSRARPAPAIETYGSRIKANVGPALQDRPCAVQRSLALRRAAPQRPIDTPQRPIDTPQRPIDAPQRPIDTPQRPIDAPQRPIDAPQRPIDGSLTPIKDNDNQWGSRHQWGSSHQWGSNSSEWGSNSNEWGSNSNEQGSNSNEWGSHSNEWGSNSNERGSNSNEWGSHSNEQGSHNNEWGSHNNEWSPPASIGARLGPLSLDPVPKPRTEMGRNRIRKEMRVLRWGSIDPGWLKRCEVGIGGGEWERGVNGDGMGVNGRDDGGGGDEWGQGVNGDGMGVNGGRMGVNGRDDGGGGDEWGQGVNGDRGRLGVNGDGGRMGVNGGGDRMGMNGDGMGMNEGGDRMGVNGDGMGMNEEGVDGDGDRMGVNEGRMGVNGDGDRMGMNGDGDRMGVNGDGDRMGVNGDGDRMGVNGDGDRMGVNGDGDRMGVNGDGDRMGVNGDGGRMGMNGDGDRLGMNGGRMGMNGGRIGMNEGGDRMGVNGDGMGMNEEGVNEGRMRMNGDGDRMGMNGGGDRMGVNGDGEGTVGPQMETPGPQMGTMGSQMGTVGPQMGTVGSQMGTVGPQMRTLRPRRGTVRCKEGTVGSEMGTVGAIGTMGRKRATVRRKRGTVGAEIGTMGPQIGTVGPQIGTMGCEGTLGSEMGTERPQMGTMGCQMGTMGPQMGTMGCEGTLGSEMGTEGPQMGTMGPQIGTMGCEGTLGSEMGTERPQMGTMGPQIGTMGCEGTLGSEMGTEGPQMGTMGSQLGTMGCEGTLGSEMGTERPQMGTVGPQIGTVGSQMGTMGCEGTLGSEMGTMGPEMGAMGPEMGAMGCHKWTMGCEGTSGPQMGPMGHKGPSGRHRDGVPKDSIDLYGARPKAAHRNRPCPIDGNEDPNEDPKPKAAHRKRPDPIDGPIEGPSDGPKPKAAHRKRLRPIDGPIEPIDGPIDDPKPRAAHRKRLRPIDGNEDPNEDPKPKAAHRKRLGPIEPIDGPIDDPKPKAAHRKKPCPIDGPTEGNEDPIDDPKPKAAYRKRLRPIEGNEDPNGDPKTAPKKRRTAPCPSQNLLGDCEEGDESNRAGSRATYNRAPRRPQGNFVRLNLKRRSHVKGAALRGRRLRKQVWKEKWRLKAPWVGGGGSVGRDRCFKCGAVGHWAAQCKGTGPTSQLPPPHNNEDEDEDEDGAPLPTIEEVARQTNTSYRALYAPSPAPDAADPIDPAPHLDIQRPPYEPPTPPAPVEPLYPIGPDGNPPAAPMEVFDALSLFGFSSFRPGQESAIMRILSGLSTLVLLPTGLGKSLCYQLPAYLYHKRSRSVAIVVSPLVSLMDDQVSSLPPCLSAVSLHSHLPPSRRVSSLRLLCSGSVPLLLVSPEVLVGSGCSVLPPQLPPVSFACIDEAHCVSQWAHGFRPSYMQLYKVLHDLFGVRCFLALTATATSQTVQDIAAHLRIPLPHGVAARCTTVPHNLRLSVSIERDRDRALVKLLRSERYAALSSIIVYCTRREDTARVAAMLRTCLQDQLPHRNTHGPNGGRILHPDQIAAAYHAGLSASERRRVQSAFMKGRLRVVVATVAFGMGLDKADVRAVLHYNMPRSFEGYVQEIGRAGRDGETAWCHLFIDHQGSDRLELRRQVFADALDPYSIKKLVQAIFPPCKCRELQRRRLQLNAGAEVSDAEMAAMMTSQEGDDVTGSRDDGHDIIKEGDDVIDDDDDGDVIDEDDDVMVDPEGAGEQERVCYKHERGIPIEKTVQELDVREEAIETLLCYLELHPRRWVQLLPHTYGVCTVQSYGGAKGLRAAARSCPPLAVALALDRVSGAPQWPSGTLQFDVVELSDRMGWELPSVKRALRGLKDQHNGSVQVQFSSLSFHVRSYGDLSPTELDWACSFLRRRLEDRQRGALRHINHCHRVLHSVAFQGCDPQPDEEEEEERSRRLKAALQEYFEMETHGHGGGEEEEDEDEGLSDADAAHVRSCLRRFLSVHHGSRFTPRSIARIFHGIGSPCYPAQIYGRDRRFWRQHLHVGFNLLTKMAAQEIMALNGIP